MKSSKPSSPSDLPSAARALPARTLKSAAHIDPKLSRAGGHEPKFTSEEDLPKFSLKRVISVLGLMAVAAYGGRWVATANMNRMMGVGADKAPSNLELRSPASAQSASFGHRLNDPASQKSVQAKVNKVKNSSTIKSKALSALPSKASAQTIALPRLVTGEAEYAKLMSDPVLANVDQDMAQAFSDSETGASLRAAATLLRFRSEQGQESQLLEQQLQFLKSTPQEALDEIQAGIGKFKNNYASERQELVQMVQTLDVDRSHKIEFFKKELINNSTQSNSSGFGAFNSEIALRSLLTQLDRPEDAEEILTQALKTASPDQKALLLSTYKHYAPKIARKLGSPN